MAEVQTTLDMEATVDEVTRSDGSRRHFTIRNEKELEKFTELFVEKDMAARVKEFGEMIKKQILREYDESIAGKSNLTFTGENVNAPASEAIREAIKRMKVQRVTEGGTRKFRMVLDSDDKGISKGLIRALNDGTGIYGKTKAPITPRNSKYLFIPGERFARLSYSKQVMKQGGRTREI